VDEDQPTRNQPPADGTPPAAETARFPRPASDETSVLPAAQEPGEPPARWSARAGVPVRRDVPEQGWAPDQEPRTWWAPVLIGVALLVLLGLIGLGLWLAVRGQPATTPSASAAPSATASSASPSPSPTPSASPSSTATMVPVPPGLVGVPVAEAQEILQAQGLNWTVVNRVSDEPAGTVVDTDPPTGTPVPAGTEITLFVATPPPSSAGPNPSNP